MALLENPHPGVILQEEFLEPLDMKAATLAKAIVLPANRISNLVNGKLGVSADTDLSLARFFKLSEGYWLRL